MAEQGAKTLLNKENYQYTGGEAKADPGEGVWEAHG
jgi:hypothetical protein